MSEIKEMKSVKKLSSSAKKKKKWIHCFLYKPDQLVELDHTISDHMFCRSRKEQFQWGSKCTISYKVQGSSATKLWNMHRRKIKAL